MNLHAIVEDFKEKRNTLDVEVATKYLSSCQDFYLYASVHTSDDLILCLKCLCNLVAYFAEKIELSRIIHDELIHKLIVTSTEESIQTNERVLTLKLLGNIISAPNLGKVKTFMLYKSLKNRLLNNKFNSRTQSFTQELFDALFMVINSVLKNRYFHDLVSSNDDEPFGYLLDLVIDSCLSEPNFNNRNFNVILQHSIVDILPSKPSLYSYFKPENKLHVTEIILDSTESASEFKQSLVIFLFKHVYEPLFEKLTLNQYQFTPSDSIIFRNCIKIFCEWSAGHYVEINETITELSLTVLILLRNCRVQKDNEVGEDNDCIHQQNVAGFVSDLTRLLANLVHRSKHKQDECYDYLPVLLENCKIDQNNPYLLEWNILLIRNLLEGNERNQKFVHELQAREVLPDELLEKLGLKDIADRKIVGK